MITNRHAYASVPNLRSDEETKGGITFRYDNIPVHRYRYFSSAWGDGPCPGTGSVCTSRGNSSRNRRSEWRDALQGNRQSPSVCLPHRPSGFAGGPPGTAYASVRTVASGGRHSPGENGTPHGSAAAKRERLLRSHPQPCLSPPLCSPRWADVAYKHSRSTCAGGRQHARRGYAKRPRRTSPA